MMKNWRSKTLDRLERQPVWLDLCTTAVITGLGALLICNLFYLHWEENDDFYMGSLANGALGERTSYIVSTNIVVGWVLKSLYLLAPGISWIAVVWEALVALSFGVILWILQKKLGWGNGLAVWTVFLLLFGRSFYTTVNFTRVASIGAAAGYLLVFYTLRERKTWGTALGMLMVAWSYAIRWESWIMITALAGGVGLWEMFGGLEGKDFSQWLHSLGKAILSKWRYLAAFGGLFLAVGLLWGGNRLYIANSDPATQYYYEYGKVRQQLTDYRKKDYDEIAQELQALDITPTEYETLIDNWVHGDPEKYTIETLQSIVDLQEGRTSNLTETLKGTVKLLAGNLFVYCTLGFLGMVLILNKRNNWFVLGWQLAFLVLLNGYLVWRGRDLTRVVESICAGAVVYILWTMTRDTLRFSPAKYGGLALTLVVAGAAVYGVGFKQKPLPSTMTQNSWTTAAQLAETGNYFLVGNIMRPDLNWLFKSEDLRTMDFGEQEHFLMAGGWTVHHPSGLGRFERAGFTNPFRALAEEDNIFLLDDRRTGPTFRYVTENYCAGMNWSVLGRIEPYEDIIAFSWNIQEEPELQEWESLSLELEESQDEDLIWIAGSWKADTDGEELYYLEITLPDGTAGTYRILPEKQEEYLAFRVGIPVEDISGDPFTAAVIQRDPEGATVGSQAVEVRD